MRVLIAALICLLCTEVQASPKATWGTSSATLSRCRDADACVAVVNMLSAAPDMPGFRLQKRLDAEGRERQQDARQENEPERDGGDDGARRKARGILSDVLTVLARFDGPVNAGR